MKNKKQIRRHFYSYLLTAFGFISLLILLCLLVSILYQLIKTGYEHFNLALLTQDTPGPSMPGGLRNAIVGSLLQTLLALVISFPLGVLAATFMYLQGKRSHFTHVMHFVNDLLLSTPSIVIGLFIYSTIVIFMGHFSGFAGSLALSIIGFPIVTRTVEDVLHLTPIAMKEAAYAIGTCERRLVFQIIYRNAKIGLISALLLALARMLGETAPLLFTSLDSSFFNFNLLQPTANLPVTIFQFAMSPDPVWQSLAWSGALLITLFILLMSLIGRVLLLRDKSCRK